MYEVGQILYLVFSDKQQVLPVQVAEQIVRKSIEGQTVSYNVFVPSKGDTNKSFDLNDIGGEPFVSLEDVRALLEKNANKAISKILDNANSMASSHFENVIENFVAAEEVMNKQTYETIPSEPGTSDDDQEVRITLENGTVANVKLGAGLK